MGKVLEDIIESLPDKYHPWAMRHGDALTKFSFEQLEAWVGTVLAGELERAYNDLAANMTTKQLLRSQSEINSELVALDAQNAYLIQMQQQAVKEALTIGLLMLRAAI